MPIFETKAKTLKVLEKNLKKAKILPQFSFTVSQWIAGKKNIMTKFIN